MTRQRAEKIKMTVNKKITDKKYLTDAEITEVLDSLKKQYPDAGCALDYDSIFHLLVAVVLSAQTTDVSVNKVTPMLFSKYKTPSALASASEEDVIEIIKSIGMYKTKSKNIIGLAKILTNQYNQEVPKSDEELMKLPGVGRKTANVVMSVGFGEQRIAVDTHVFRVSNRIGLANAKDVLTTEKQLMQNVPKERWTQTHHLLIFHGRRCCTARNPSCDTCAVRKYCKYDRLKERGKKE